MAVPLPSDLIAMMDRGVSVIVASREGPVAYRVERAQGGVSETPIEPFVIEP